MEDLEIDVLRALAPADASDEDPQTARARARVFAALMGEAAGPATIGRFILLHRLGVGGMGVVWAAFDPDLDRNVAIKLVRDDRPQVRGRLVREARAMAKLTHPNVAAVYEVGTHEGELYLAMELVRGETLQAWIDRAPRSWQEVLAVYEQAGRGLAAAHALGLVHRDFKPDNAILGADGRVRVVDFGLARRGDDEALVTSGDIDDPRADGDSASTPLTRTGAMVGTPAYMAPEQFHGRPTDARTDQFAFCVALWEALFDQRPFAGTSPSELVGNVTAGRLREPARMRGVPAFVIAVLRRGLQVRPESRHPTMDALLHAIARGASRARWRRAVTVLGTAAVLGAGVWGYSALQRRHVVGECEASGASIAEVWNDDVRARASAALAATGVAYAEQTADKAMPWLDAHASRWSTVQTEACLDAKVYGTWDDDMLARAQWCLDERRLELAALVEALLGADTRAVENVVPAVAGLSSIEGCRDADLLARLPAPPAQARDEIEAVRAELARVRALQRTRAYVEGLRRARSALAEAESIGWPPLAAAARRSVADLLDDTGDLAGAEQMLEVTFFEAAHAGAVELAADVAESLVVLVGSRQARPVEGLRWSRLAELFAASLPDPSGLRAAAHTDALARLRFDASAYREADELHAHALELFEAALGPVHPKVAVSLGELAMARRQVGDLASAMALSQRALAITQAVYGEGHPAISVALDRVAIVHQELGEYREAAALHERVVAIREAAYGSEHLEVARARMNLAGALVRLEENARAKQESLRVLAVWERTLGPDHPDVGLAAANLGHALLGLGELAAADEQYARALAIHERALGPDHDLVAGDLNDLALVKTRIGDFAAAKSLLERALVIAEKAYGPEHDNVARQLDNLGIVLRELGDHAQARRAHERALAIRERLLGPDHPDVADSLDNLAGTYEVVGDYRTSQRLLVRALGILERALGPDHLAVARVLDNLGNVHLLLEEYDEARDFYTRALAIEEATLDRDHPQLAFCVGGLASAAIGLGRFAEAVPLAERALALRRPDSTTPANIAEAQFVLARALWSADPADRSRALALAEQARDTYREVGEPSAEALAEVDRWLAAAGRARRR